MVSTRSGFETQPATLDDEEEDMDQVEYEGTQGLEDSGLGSDQEELGHAAHVNPPMRASPRGPQGIPHLSLNSGRT